MTRLKYHGGIVSVDKDEIIEASNKILSDTLGARSTEHDKRQKIESESISRIIIKEHLRNINAEHAIGLHICEWTDKVDQFKAERDLARSNYEAMQASAYKWEDCANEWMQKAERYKAALEKISEQHCNVCSDYDIIGIARQALAAPVEP